MKRPLPEHESQRLEALLEYKILDTPPEEAFNDLTQLASYICGTPIALVSLVDKNRHNDLQLYKIERSNRPPVLPILPV